MSLSETLSTLWSVGRVLPHVPKILPSARANPSTQLRSWAEATPTALALSYGGSRYTWKDLNDHANRWAFWLGKQGIGSGDVVAMVMDNRPEFLFALHGLSKLGAVAALINTNLSGQPLEHAIRVSGARRILSGSEHLDAVAEVVPGLEGLDAEHVWVQADEGAAPTGEWRWVGDEIAAAPAGEMGGDRVPGAKETFCFIYTSGTTGLPKAAIITNQRMLLANFGFGHLMHRSGAGDVIYVPLPLYHSSALFLGWGAALGTGAAVALRRKFSASAFWKDVREQGATSFLYIGELCRYLLNTPPQEGERDHRLRVGVGNGMRPDIWEKFQERFGVPVIREFYGATEGNTVLMNMAGRVGMIGRMAPGQAILRCDQETGEVIRNDRGLCDTVDIGEIGLLVGRISGATGFDGYVDREATRKKVLTDVLKKGDQYFNTGDLVQVHAGRWLSFADRVGDTFRWKGENVSTNEVADLLDGADGVLEANVYGVQVPHADGRAGMAALTVDDSFDLERFAAYVGEGLPRYQRPLFLRLLGGQMQVTGTFKHQKVDYRKQGFDPAEVSDPLYLLQNDRYVPLDAALHAAIESGEVAPG
ncbi:MAG: long-chain-acyl-CoA synthetase [Myxococcota bacterium]